MPVGEHVFMSAQGREWAAERLDGKDSTWRWHLAQMATQVRVFPILNATCRETRNVVKVNSMREAHAATGRYLSYPSASS